VVIDIGGDKIVVADVEGLMRHSAAVCEVANRLLNSAADLMFEAQYKIPQPDFHLSAALANCAKDCREAARALPPNVFVSDGPADAPELTRSAEGPFAARNG
jgi:hypothetical protein